MAPNRILLNNGCVLSVDPKVGNFHKADVLIEGSEIAAVGTNLSAADAEVIDASNSIVMPGFVDTHRHVWEGILRNIATDCPLEGDASYLAFILNTLVPVYRPEDAYVGDLVGLLGALDAGITTILDWSHIQATREHADAVIRALQESGIRAVFAYGYPWWKYPDEHQDEWIRDVARQYFSSKDQLLTFGMAPPARNLPRLRWPSLSGSWVARSAPTSRSTWVSAAPESSASWAKWARPACWDRTRPTSTAPH